MDVEKADENEFHTPLDVREINFLTEVDQTIIEEILSSPNETFLKNIEPPDEPSAGEKRGVGQVEHDALTALCDLAGFSEKVEPTQMEICGKNDDVSTDVQAAQKCASPKETKMKIVDESTHENSALPPEKISCLACILCPPKFLPNLRLFSRVENKILAKHPNCKQMLLYQPLIVLQKCDSILFFESSAGKLEPREEFSSVESKNLADETKEQANGTKSGSNVNLKEISRKNTEIPKKCDDNDDECKKSAPKNKKSLEISKQAKSQKLAEMAQRVKSTKDVTCGTPNSKDKGKNEAIKSALVKSNKLVANSRLTKLPDPSPSLQTMGVDLRTPDLSTFKIKKLDPKAATCKSNLHKINTTAKLDPSTPKNQAIAYVSPLDRILDESNRFAAHTQGLLYEHPAFKRKTDQNLAGAAEKFRKLDGKLDWKGKNDRWKSGDFVEDKNSERKSLSEKQGVSYTGNNLACQKFEEKHERRPYGKNDHSEDSKMDNKTAEQNAIQAEPWSPHSGPHESPASDPAAASPMSSALPPQNPARPILLGAAPNFLDRDRSEKFSDAISANIVGILDQDKVAGAKSNLDSFLDDVLRSRQSTLFDDIPGLDCNSVLSSCSKRPSLLGAHPPSRNPGLLPFPTQQPSTFDSSFGTAAGLTTSGGLNWPSLGSHLLDRFPPSSSRQNLASGESNAGPTNSPWDVSKDLDRCDTSQAWNRSNDMCAAAAAGGPSARSSRPVLLPDADPYALAGRPTTKTPDNRTSDIFSTAVRQTTTTATEDEVLANYPLLSNFMSSARSATSTTDPKAMPFLAGLNAKSPSNPHSASTRIKKFLTNQTASSLRSSDAESYFLSTLTSDNLAELLKQVEEEEVRALSENVASNQKRQLASEASKFNPRLSGEVSNDQRKTENSNFPSELARSIHGMLQKSSTADGPNFDSSKNSNFSAKNYFVDPDGQSFSYSLDATEPNGNLMYPNYRVDVQKPGTSKGSQNSDVDYRRNLRATHPFDEPTRISSHGPNANLKVSSDSSKQTDAERALALMLSDDTDDATLQNFLLDFTSELKNAGIDRKEDCAEITQLKVVFQTLLSEPSSVLGKDLEKRRQVERIIPVLDIARFLDCPATQTAFIMPVMQFAQDLIEMSFS